MGGAVLQIIPRQALNYEAGRFFEVYHSSRESFTFLKHFSDAAQQAEAVPQQAAAVPQQAVLQQAL